jgi:hypothetical protein
VNIPADQSIFLAKAEESLAGAESELAAGRYYNCVNRCYYACFQAAVVALMHAGVVRPVPTVIGDMLLCNESSPAGWSIAERTILAICGTCSLAWCSCGKRPTTILSR